GRPPGARGRRSGTTREARGHGPFGGGRSRVTAPGAANGAGRPPARCRAGPARVPVARGSGGLALGGDQAAPQLGDRLAVDLADPALGHAEHLADLGQGEAVVVVERDDVALAGGEAL